MHWIRRDPDQRTLGRVLRDQADVIGDDVFIIDEDRKLSFNDVNDRVNAVAAGLRRLGAGKGTAVACLLDNSPDAVMTSIALGKLGAIFIPSNIEFRRDFLLRTFVQGNAETLIVEEELVSAVAEIWDDYNFKNVVVRGRSAEARATLKGARIHEWESLSFPGSGEPAEADDVTPRDIAAVMWTSGTTGPPKGVMQSHNLWVVDADFMLRTRGVREDDVFFNFLPLYQSGSWLMNIYPALVSGLPVAIDPRFSVAKFWERCRFYGATQVLTLGAMHMYLWQAPERPDDADNPVRVATCIGMPHTIQEPFKCRFGIEFICVGFGQSECMPVTMTNPTGSYKPDSCGTARDGIEVAALGEDDRPMPAGSPGEICVRPTEPDVIFTGFYRDDHATVTAFRNLWYHTGDLGYLDKDGELFFVDRKADFMRYKGRNISSFEVESVVAKHPQIVECAAHGVAADELAVEDEIKLCVVLTEGAELTPADIVEYYRDNAPKFMVPRYVEIFSELPHTPTGRVQKYLLRKMGVTGRTWDQAKSETPSVGMKVR